MYSAVFMTVVSKAYFTCRSIEAATVCYRVHMR